MGSITSYTLPPFLPTCTQSNKQPSLRLPTIPQQLCWHDKEWLKHSNDKLQCCIKQPPSLYASTKTGSHVTLSGHDVLLFPPFVCCYICPLSSVPPPQPSPGTSCTGSATILHSVLHLHQCYCSLGGRNRHHQVMLGTVSCVSFNK